MEHAEETAPQEPKIDKNRLSTLTSLRHVATERHVPLGVAAASPNPVCGLGLRERVASRMRSVIDRQRNDTISKIVGMASITVDSVYQRS